MYLVGAPHPHKVDAQRLLENLLSESDIAAGEASVDYAPLFARLRIVVI